ncbi:MAG TPA: hypothetical protein VJK48_04625 [Chlamydiales bacterium]|nr:hypothetical protein [Chlamydiales bacterium]
MKLVIFASLAVLAVSFAYAAESKELGAVRKKGSTSEFFACGCGCPCGDKTKK